MARQGTPISHRISSLEGLRGLAACMVVLGHLRVTFFQTLPQDLHQRLTFLPAAVAWPIQALLEGLYNGTFAVWLFWIMSGFVLAFQFFVRAQTKDGPRAHDYLKEAALRRYPRLLLPVLASVMFAYALHARHLMHNGILGRLEGPCHSLWLAGFYAFPPSFGGALKCAFWQSFFANDNATSYNNVLWSMEAEFYGSMFLFAFLAVLGLRRCRWLGYPVALVASYALQRLWLDAFVVGILLCDLYVHRSQWRPRLEGCCAWPGSLREGRWLAGLLWLTLIIAAARPVGGEGMYVVVGSLAVALTLVSAPTQRFLSAGVPLFLGRISFGLYLIHHPLICSFACWLYLRTFGVLGHLGAAALASVLTCVLSVVLGWGLYRVADAPAIRFSRWLSGLVRRRGPGL